MEAYRRAAEIRQIQQQTELLRQQTEALRRENGEPNREIDPQLFVPAPPWDPEVAAQSPSILSMSTKARNKLLQTMPKPTGDPARDELAWRSWSLRLKPGVQEALPFWGADCYDEVRAILKGR
jgi:type II secretory pathway pseudopilin PulG